MIMNTKEHLDLQEQYELSLQKVAEAQVEFDAALIELKALDACLLDADQGQRVELIRQRVELSGHVDALKEIITGLRFRRDAAFLAIFEFNEAQETQEAKKAYKKNKEKNTQLSQAKEELQKFNNGRSGDMTEKERDEKFTKLQINVAQLSAELQISFRDFKRAKATLEHAQSETVRVRNVLNSQAQ
jgi:hypothetical protein